MIERGVVLGGGGDGGGGAGGPGADHETCRAWPQPPPVLRLTCRVAPLAVTLVASATSTSPQQGQSVCFHPPPALQPLNHTATVESLPFGSGGSNVSVDDTKSRVKHDPGLPDGQGTSQVPLWCTPVAAQPVPTIMNAAVIISRPFRWPIRSFIRGAIDRCVCWGLPRPRGYIVQCTELVPSS